MTTTEVWAVILGGMAVTYAARLSFIMLPQSERLPPFFRRGLRLVAPAVLAAILAPQVFLIDSGIPIVLSPRPWAAGVAALIGWRTRNAWLAIGGGMVTLWVLQSILPG